MDELKKLKQEIEKLQERLSQERARRVEIERRSALLEKLAYRDPQTGLRTEQYLHTRLREEIDRATRFPAATTLVTLSLPGSRVSNLAALGQRLIDELRATDHVFQMQDNGIAILLVETPGEGAHHVLQRIADDLKQFSSEYASSVTSFPVDANVADDFMRVASERHRQAAQRLSGQQPTANGQPVH